MSEWRLARLLAAYQQQRDDRVSGRGFCVSDLDGRIHMRQVDGIQRRLVVVKIIAAQLGQQQVERIVAAVVIVDRQRNAGLVGDLGEERGVSGRVAEGVA